jgi:hypothetical protein
VSIVEGPEVLLSLSADAEPGTTPDAPPDPPAPEAQHFDEGAAVVVAWPGSVLDGSTGTVHEDVVIVTTAGKLATRRVPRDKLRSA